MQKTSISLSGALYSHQYVTQTSIYEDVCDLVYIQIIYDKNKEIHTIFYFLNIYQVLHYCPQCVLQVSK